MQQHLQGVPETLLIPLWARAAETKEQRPIIRDEIAVELVAQIDYDFSKFNDSWMTQTGVAVRTEILDREVKEFIGRHPDTVIINIGCGLDTRYFRVDNGRIRWYDLDLPEVIGIRKNFFQETRRYHMIGKSVFDYSWLKDIEIGGAPVLLLAEGVFMYFTEQEMTQLLGSLTKQFPKAQMFFEMMPRMLVKSGSKHETVRKTSARFQWGIKRGKDMEELHSRIRFVDEWNYFDYHRARWKWLGRLALIPVFRNNFNNRIVHITL
ncbi:MAG: class I SAM-dependent methyltransferase [Peptococcaceae bacterium]